MKMNNENQDKALKKADNGEELTDNDIDALCDWIEQEWDKLEQGLEEDIKIEWAEPNDRQVSKK